jgi:hypothetical protein
MVDGRNLRPVGTLGRGGGEVEPMECLECDPEVSLPCSRQKVKGAHSVHSTVMSLEKVEIMGGEDWEVQSW